MSTVEGRFSDPHIRRPVSLRVKKCSKFLWLTGGNIQYLRAYSIILLVLLLTCITADCCPWLSFLPVLKLKVRVRGHCLYPWITVEYCCIIACSINTMYCLVDPGTQTSDHHVQRSRRPFCPPKSKTFTSGFFHCWKLHSTVYLTFITFSKSPNLLLVCRR